MIERNFLEQLAGELRSAVDGTSVERLSGDALRVLVPNPRWAHDWVALTIEASEDGLILSDAGELGALAGNDVGRFVELLNCTGADLEVSDGVATMTVTDPSDTARAVLSLAHYVIAAPVVWHARRCLSDDARDGQEPSAVRELAKTTKQRLTGRFGDSVGGLVRLHSIVRDRGERARVPMVMSTASKAPPKLISTFVDFDASETSISAAKRQTTWVYDVARDMRVPKFIVVRGSSDHIDHIANFYDHHEITTVPFAHPDALEESVGEIATDLGLPVS